MRPLGGAELWMLEAARGLQERGHPVSLITQPDAELYRHAQQAGLATTAIPIRCDGAPWTIAKLTRHFRNRKVDVIFCNLTKDLKAAGVAGRLAGVPVILSSRESDFPLKDKLYYRFYFNKIATGIVVNSLATHRTVVQSAPWLDPSRVHLLYKGVDLQRFRPAANPPTVPTVGFVGQLVQRKGLPEIMAAWQLIEQDTWQEPPRLHLAGEGVLRGRLESWRTRLRHPERVRICGFQENIPAFMSDLTLLVLPSREEGFGLAAAEASACGLPVVATTASSLPEIIVDGQTGILVPPRDSAALAQAVKMLLDNQEQACQLGTAGRCRVVEHFDHQLCLDKLQEIIRGRSGP